MKKIKIKNFEIGDTQKLTVISGPCVIENEDHAMHCAKELKDIFKDFNINYIFKASYDKANRSSIHSFRGPGIEKGIKILEKIKKEYDLPILTDVHSPEDVEIAKNVCDIIQIPAFLCRQTDLLKAAAKSQKPINIKKGQFVAPWDVFHIIEKIKSFNNDQIILTDRGTSFGYNNLVSDMRSIPIMQKFGYPVCFDASHSTQLPSKDGNESGGESEFIPHLSKAAIAAGANALFIESHPNPEIAKSDSKTVLDFKILKVLLRDFERLYKLINEK